MEVFDLATVIDVAKYMLHTRAPITPMMLEKLCFYSQCWALAWTEEPLFDEDFQAWNVGAVCLDLYKAVPNKVLLQDGFLGEYDPNALDESQKESIDIVLNDYADYEPWDFTLKIRGERPWRNARKNYSEKDKEFPLISKLEMYEFHAGLLMPPEKRDMSIYIR